MRLLSRIAIAAIAMLVGAQQLRAQEAERAPLVLELPASTRALALGVDFVPVGADPDAIFHNPALLTSARGIGVALQRYRSASTYASFSTAIEMAPGGLGVGVQLLDYGARAADPTGTAAGAASLLGRGPILASNLAATIGYARPVKGTRFGIAGKLVEQRTGGDRGHAFAVDIGAARELFDATIAIAVRNLGGELEIDGVAYTLPRRAVLSAAHPSKVVGPFDLITTTSVAALEDGTISPALGAELAWWPVVGKTFVARVGVRRPESDGVAAVVLGGGFIGDRFSLDYAYEGFDSPGGAHRLGIRWR